MTLKEYQKFCARGILPATLEREPIVGFALGLAGEAGEVVDDIKKKYFHGRDIDPQHTIEELGDVMWYVANIATQLGVSIEELIEYNVSKLSKRYPAMYEPKHQIEGNLFCAKCGKTCSDDAGTIHYEQSGPHTKATCAHCGAFLKFIKKEKLKDDLPF